MENNKESLFWNGLIENLKKYVYFMLVAACIAGALFYVYVQKSAQQFTAEAVIEYASEDGNAPDGTKIDVSEITSSEIIAAACKDLDLAEANIDEIRSSITIKEIVDEEEEAMYLSKLDHGEEYEIITTRYHITFSCDLTYGKEYPKQMLNAILSEYFKYYGKTHASVGGAVNSISGVSLNGYDYIEMMDIINDSLSQTEEMLLKRIGQNEEFRSNETGYSFNDLYDEFSYISNQEAPKISTEILMNRVTKDKNLLITKYKARTTDLGILNDTEEEKIEKIEEIIDSYVTMMESSANVDLKRDYILGNVYDEDTWYWHPNADKTTEYDQLLRNYVSAASGHKFNLIDIAYNKYVIDTFSSGTVAGAKEQAKVQEKIDALVEELSEWFRILDLTTDEYNEYLGAKNIQMLTNVTVARKIQTKKFTVMIIGAVFMLQILLFIALFRVYTIIREEKGKRIYQDTKSELEDIYKEEGIIR